MPPTADDLDYVALDGQHRVILASGARIEPTEPLPREAGVYLVAGQARPGGLRPVASFPGGWSSTCLSPDYRWLGVVEETNLSTLRLYDTTQRFRPGFSFEIERLSSSVAIHPSGEMIACRVGDDLQIHLPDGEVLRSATYPRPEGAWWDEAFLVSPCGGYLWFAHATGEERGRLFLLRCPGLELLDSCPPGFDPRNPYDSEDSWLELTATPGPATNHIALSREIGDDFLTLDFYTVRNNRIQHHPRHVFATDGDIPGERAGGAYFGADGRSFLVLDSDGFLHEFSFPDCEHLASRTDSELGEGAAETRDIDTFGFSGEHILVSLDEELLALRSGEMQQSLLGLGVVREVLPSGLVLTDREVQAYHLEAERLPVVVELDSEMNRVRAVYHRRGGGWADITAEVGWVETQFRLAEW
jgi:hypothetical protein